MLVILRADNGGVGGSLALLALVADRVGTRKWTAGIVMLGILATALFYGDAIITPAISVLSAVEGLTVIEPGLGAAVLGGTSSDEPVADDRKVEIFSWWGSGSETRALDALTLSARVVAWA